MTKIKDLNLTTKFMLGIGIILFLAVSLFSLIFYDYLKDLYVREAYQKTDLVLGQIEASMTYVRDELRPRMYHVLPHDEFIREAMSTSFVTTGIMRRFEKRFPDYAYRRVALDPMNPKNKTDAFEEGFANKAVRRPGGAREWKGLVDRDGKKYFMHMKAVVMEEQCALCHGDPSHAPRSLLQRYGRKHGHFWKVGDVIGVESVSIPVDQTFYQIRQVAFAIFLAGLAGMSVLFLSLNYFYYRVAVKPLKAVSAFFKSIVSGQQGLTARFAVTGQDEIAEVAESFNRMVSHLKQSRDERNEMEEKMRQAEKLASIGQLAAGVAHEINNPLSVILGFTNILRKDCPGEGPFREDLRTIHDNAQICKKIVEDLLNFARQTRIQPVDADLNSIIESAVASMEAAFLGEGVTIERTYDPAIQRCTADVDKIRQVVVNLLTNARQAMKTGGVITLQTQYDGAGRRAFIVIADRGGGIPKRIQCRVFEPFFTTKEPGQGTGLGLAVSYGIIKEHKGEISFESEENRGTTFRIWLPL
jgi:signal transduction histidine kinase